MPLTNSMIAWALRFAASPLSLRVLTNATTETLSRAITPGRNYWLVDDGQADADGGLGGVGSLITWLQALLNQNTGGGTYTVTFNANFTITISCNTGTNLYWSDALSTPGLAALFGFLNITYSGNTTYTGPNLPSGLWRPLQPLGTDTREREPTVGGIGVALAGAQRTSSLVDHPKKIRTISWLRVDQSVALVEYQVATQPTGSFEYAWLNALKLGRPCRLYIDESQHNSASGYAGPYRITDFSKDPLVRTNPSISNTRWGVGPLMLRAM